MVQPSVIEARLGELGFTTNRWFRAEIRELQHILMDNEKIISLVCGRYFGSFALLVATDQRLLLIDKRVFFMTLEDTRYDMISEIDYNSQVYSATVTVFTMNKTHKFTSIKFKHQLRDLTRYVQQRVMEFRQQQPSGAPELLNPQLRFMRPASTVPLAPELLPVLQADIPQPKSVASQDYYVSGTPPMDRHRVGHVSHLIGSAATYAAHHHTPAFTHRPFNPYVQGSLMTRHPIS